MIKIIGKFVFVIMVVLIFSTCAKGSPNVVGCEEAEGSIAQKNANGLLYKNNRYCFSASILPNFEVQYLPDEGGILMKRTAEAKIVVKRVEQMDKYEVQISMRAFKNDGKYKDLSDFLMKNYKSFSKEFLLNGVYVYENVGADAINHYFVMSSDGEIIYESFLKVPSIHYNLHKAGYENFVKTIRIF